MSRFLRSLSAAAALVLSVAGCDQLLSQLESDHVAVAMLVKVPEQQNPVPGGQPLPGVVRFQLFLGAIQKSAAAAGLASGATPGATGLAGAQVKLLFRDTEQNVDLEVPIPDKGAGAYDLDSLTDARLKLMKTEYTAQIVHGGHTYKLKVTPPEPSDIAEVAAAPLRVIKDHPENTDLRLTRANIVAENPIAFVNLAQVSPTTKADHWTNAPTDAMGLLSLALNDGAWRADSFTIPGAKFASGAGYVVTLTSLAQGQVDGSSSALFLGSTFFAGVASGGGVLVK